jgi:uncharacterized protein (DUF983 family)
MCAEKSQPRPNILWSVFTNRCPRCRQGKLYANPNPYAFKGDTMYTHCPVCGQRYHLHTGFFFGTGYVSYALSIAVMAAVFVAWGVLFGLSFNDNSLLWCFGVATAILIILQPVLQRLSRSMWIAMFVKYDPNWRESKTSAELFN